MTPSADATDLEVAEALAAGSAEALQVAYERWGRLIYTIAFRAVGNREDADEITQQVFVSAWTSRHLLVPSVDAMPRWLVGITRNRIADLRRAQFRLLRRVDAFATEVRSAPSPDVDLAVIDQLTLAYELDRLGPPRDSILTMFYLEDRTQQEIAERLNMPVNTVKSHLRRGLAELRTRIGGDDGD